MSIFIPFTSDYKITVNCKFSKLPAHRIMSQHKDISLVTTERAGADCALDLYRTSSTAS